ncbi:hypothetical protein B0H10DRAFT_1775913, partial [Mycena sp. CBHHK59/15]
DGVLYKLHPGLLSARSRFFTSMFSLPRGVDTSEQILSEGKTDDNAIQLLSTLDQSDFDGLLTYLYMGPSAHPKTAEFLISVMKLCVFFDIEDGVTYTTNELVRLGEEVHPALQFELAHCCGVDTWIEPAFRRLMNMDLLSLDSPQVSQIGHWGYFWLTQTKAKIQKFQNQVAFNVPPIVNSGECDTPDTCADAWTREWEENVRQLLHHPEQPISCLDLLYDLRNAHIEGLCDRCQDLTVTWIWGTCLLTQERDFIDEAVVALMDLQTDQPLRAALIASLADNTIINYCLRGDESSELLLPVLVYTLISTSSHSYLILILFNVTCTSRIWLSSVEARVISTPRTTLLSHDRAAYLYT